MKGGNVKYHGSSTVISWTLRRAFRHKFIDVVEEPDVSTFRVVFRIRTHQIPLKHRHNCLTYTGTATFTGATVSISNIAIN